MCVHIILLGNLHKLLTEMVTTCDMRHLLFEISAKLSGTNFF